MNRQNLIYHKSPLETLCKYFLSKDVWKVYNTALKTIKIYFWDEKTTKKGKPI